MHFFELPQDLAGEKDSDSYIFPYENEGRQRTHKVNFRYHVW